MGLVDDERVQNPVQKYIDAHTEFAEINRDSRNITEV